MVLVYPYLHHTLHLPFQPQGTGYSLACFHVLNPFLPRDCKAVHTPIEPCWDPCRGTLVAFKQIPSYQVKGQTHSAASFLFGLPDFVSARLRKFRRIMSFSFHIKMPSCVSPSPQKCHLQGRVSQRSHVSQVRARNLTSQTQLSPLNSSWALRGWLSIKMAGTPTHVPEKRRAAVQDQQTDQQTPRAFHGADERCSTPSIVGIPSGDCQSSSNELVSLLGGFGAGNPVGLQMQTAPVKSQ